MFKLVITQGVKEYRRTISSCVTKNDVVLEIGFAWGTTTSLLYQRARKVVGIDKGKSYYAAVKKYPHIQFKKIDAFNIREVLSLGYQFNKIYIDISGCRSLFDVLKIILMYKSAFKPELIVVKSSQLKRFVENCVIWPKQKENRKWGQVFLTKKRPKCLQKMRYIGNTLEFKKK